MLLRPQQQKLDEVAKRLDSKLRRGSLSGRKDYPDLTEYDLAFLRKNHPGLLAKLSAAQSSGLRGSRSITDGRRKKMMRKTTGQIADLVLTKIAKQDEEEGIPVGAAAGALGAGGLLSGINYRNQRLADQSAATAATTANKRLDTAVVNARKGTTGAFAEVQAASAARRQAESTAKNLRGQIWGGKSAPQMPAGSRARATRDFHAAMDAAGDTGVLSSKATWTGKKKELAQALKNQTSKHVKFKPQSMGKSLLSGKNLKRLGRGSLVGAGLGLGAGALYKAYQD